MNCERARERMMEWMDGRLAPAAATEVKEHVDGCPACQAELAEMRRMAALLDASPAVKPSPALRRAVLAAIEAEKSPSQRVERMPPPALPRRRPRWSLVFQPLAACLLLVGGYFLGVRHSPKAAPIAPTDSTQRQLNELRDTVGQLVGYTLQQQQHETTNQRLEGVIATASLHQPDRQAVDSLIGTLALDPSANVRLSAVQALYAHADQEVVRTAIMISLPREQSPLVQLAMIDFLAAAKDHEARPALEKLSADTAADVNVREAAGRALAEL